MLLYRIAALVCSAYFCTVTPCVAEQYAFLVGVKSYPKDQLTSLTYTESDVHALAELLQKQGFPADNMVLMTERHARQTRFQNNPTAKNIRREFGLLLAELRPEDSLVVAFSGHGVQFENENFGYFCPIDVELQDRQTLISLQEIYAALGKAKARSKVLLVDACRNDPQSKASKTAAREIHLEPVTEFQQLAPPSGVQAYFSCSAGEQSFEDEDLQHGVFFHFLLEGLQGPADVDRDREITFGELDLYVTRRVQKYVRQHLSHSQRPASRSDKEGHLALVKLGADSPSPQPNVPPAPAPKPNPALARERLEAGANFSFARASYFNNASDPQLRKRGGVILKDYNALIAPKGAGPCQVWLSEDKTKVYVHAEGETLGIRASEVRSILYPQ